MGLRDLHRLSSWGLRPRLYAVGPSGLFRTLLLVFGEAERSRRLGVETGAARLDLDVIRPGSCAAGVDGVRCEPESMGIALNGLGIGLTPYASSLMA